MEKKRFKLQKTLRKGPQSIPGGPLRNKILLFYFCFIRLGYHALFSRLKETNEIIEIKNIVNIDIKVAVV